MVSPTSMVLSTPPRQKKIPPPASAVRHSPRILEKLQEQLDQLKAAAAMSTSPLSQDNNLLTPQPLLPLPPPDDFTPDAKSAKAAAAAKAAESAKKLKRKIQEQEASRGKEPKLSLRSVKKATKAQQPKPPSSTQHAKRNKRPPSNTKNNARGRMAKIFNRDNFFDDDDDDDSKNHRDYEDGDDDDYIFREEEDDDDDNDDHDADADVVAGAAVDTKFGWKQDTATSFTDAAAMVARHREVFMERAFGGDEEQANNVICRPQAELNEIIFILEHWEVGVSLKSIEDPEQFRVVKAFRDTHKAGYKYVNKYWIEYIQLPEEPTRRAVLRRKEKDKASGGRIVVSREHVFDAIDEWHRKRGHMGQERTHNYCREKYYNCTQKLVIIYCETCFVCMQKNPTVAPLKGSRKPIRSNHFRERFQIDLIDFRKMRKRDPFGVLMRWIMTVKDHSTGFTYVCALPRKTARAVAHKLQEVFGLIGYPSIFHTDNGKEFTAKAILRFLRSLNPSIITVTGRPRKPSDQGSVESMNRTVKRILGSELAERRMAGENPNWTEVLGTVMSTINSNSGRCSYSTSSYMSIFGKTYDQEISCSSEEVQKCWTVDERMKVSTTVRKKPMTTTRMMMITGKPNHVQMTKRMR